MEFRKVLSDHIATYRNEVLKGSSASTFDRKIFSLKKFFDWAVKEGYIDENPVEAFLDKERDVIETKLGKIEKEKKLNVPSYNSFQARIVAKFAGKPKLQKFLYNLFYTRPNWYKSYHSLPIAGYFNYAILVLLMSVLGFGVYNQFFKATSQSLAYPTSLTMAGRYLSFQGRLTNNLSNPITVATNIDFKLYNASQSGTLLWDSGACSISPDTDGIFSTLLGSSCGAEISSSVFSENAAVWLGVTVAGDAEATPRVQIATVAYALNSETLQGYPASASATANTVPVMNNLGQIVLAASSPKIQSTSGAFAIEGQTLTITTPNTSNGAITINPDGTGTLNLTFEGAAPGGGAGGFVNATNANITSGALYYGEVASNATGYNLIELKSGSSPTDKFAVDSTGTVTTGIWNGSAVGAQWGGTGANNSTVAQYSVPYYSATGVLGGAVIPSTAGYVLSTNNTGGAPSWIPMTATGTNYWALGTGTIYPGNVTMDLLLGSASTSSAKFAFTGVAGGTPTATIAGTTQNAATYLTGDGNLAVTNGGHLTLGGAYTGQVDVSNDLNLANTKSYYINGTSVLNATTLGTNVVTSSLTTVGALASGSIANGFGTIATANTITGTTLNGTTGINTGATAGIQRIDASGNLVNIGTTQLHGITYTWPAADAGVSGYVLSSNASGALSWVAQSAVGGGTWTIDNAGVIYPNGQTLDVLIGGTATASAKFAFKNVLTGTPTASISGSVAGNATYLDGNGNLSTTKAQTLTLGGTYTGNVVIDSRGATALTANGADLTAGGTVTLPNSITLTGVSGYLQSSAGFSVGGGTVYYFNNLGNLNANGGTFAGNLDVNGTVNDIAGTLNLSGDALTSSGDLTITPAGGQVVLPSTVTLNAGGITGVAYNAFASSSDTAATTAITASNDLFVGGDTEIKGGLYLTGKNIFNVVGGVSTGTITFAAAPTAVNNYNALGYGSWLINNSVNDGIAALMVNQSKGTSAIGDIFTASASGTTKFTIHNDSSFTMAGSTTAPTSNTTAGTVYFDTDTVTGSGTTGSLYLRGEDSAWHRVALDMTAYASTSANISNGGYVAIAHNQNTNDLSVTGWVYDTITSTWKNISDFTHNIIQNLKNQFDSTYIGKFNVDTAGTLTNNLVSYWKLDEATAATRVDSKGGNNLSDNASVAQVTGKVGNGASFTAASSQFLSCTDGNCGGTTSGTGLDFDASQSFSYGAWFQTSTSGVNQIIVGKKNDTTTAAGYALYLDSSNKITCRIADGTHTGYKASSATTYADGNWHYATCVVDRDAQTLTLYIGSAADGSSSSTSTVTATLDNSNDFRIGALGNNSYYFNGSIDEVGIWNKALSVTEVSNLYNSGTGNQFTGSINSNYNQTQSSLTNIALSPSVNTGTGADGAITVSSDASINATNLISGRSCADGGDAVNYSVSSLTSTTAILSSTPATGCLTAGDEVLLINLQSSGAIAKTNLGNYETLRVSSVVGLTVTFITAKSKFYGDNATDDTNLGTTAGTQRVMLQRVPNYTNVTVNSGINFTPTAFNGAKGGVMFFRAKGTVTATGNITASGYGYRGGAAGVNDTSAPMGGEAYCGANNGSAGGNGGDYDNNPTPTAGTCGGGGGAGGTRYAAGFGAAGSASYGGAGGGGGNAYYLGTAASAGGGGGGGHVTYGSGGTGFGTGINGGTDTSGAGGDPKNGTAPYFAGGGGGGGTVYASDTTAQRLTFGSGGAGGGGGYDGVSNVVGGAGGAGGGVVYIASNNLSVSGTVKSNGSNGGNGGVTYGGGGGGGAGGTVFLTGNSLIIGTNLVSATAGSGGTPTANKGGDGGNGKTAIFYQTSYTGSANSPTPTYTPQPYYPFGLYHSPAIATTNAVSLDKIKWDQNLNTYGKIEMQTRTGNTTDPSDGTWEVWKPALTNTNYVIPLNTANTHTDWVSSSTYTPSTLVVADGDVTRSVVDYEDDTESTVGNITKMTTTSNQFAYDSGSTLTTSLTSYWPLNETSAGSSPVTRMDSVVSNNLTDNGNTSSGTGKLGNDIIPNGTSQYLSCTDASCGGTASNQLDIGSGSFSISTWVYNSGSGTRLGTQSLVTKGTALGQYSYQMYLATGSGTLAGPPAIDILNTTTTGGGSSVYMEASSSARFSGLSTGWHHIVGVFNSGTPSLTLYVDNSSVATTTSTSGTKNVDSTSDFRIGYGGVVPTKAGALNYAAVPIDEVGIWKKALSTTEISDLYNSAAANTYPVNGSGAYAEASPTSCAANTCDLSGFDYLTYWVRSSQTGNTVKFGFGESAGNEQEQAVTINTANTWQKVYWDISNISSSSRNAVTKLRLTNLTASANTIYIDNVRAEKALSVNTGSAITSTPNNYIQYRTIFTTTNTAYQPQLNNVNIDYNDGYKIVQADTNNVQLYNYSGSTQNLRLDATVFGADLAEWYTVNDNAITSGDVVAITGQMDENGVPILRKANGKSDPNLIGIVSTKAGQTLGIEANNRRLLALAGRVPVKIDPASPAIAAGDGITSSETPGMGRRAEFGDIVIAKAAQAWNPGGAATLFVIVSSSNSRNTYLANIENYSLIKNALTGTWQAVSTSTGEAIDSVAAFSNMIAANIKAGAVTTGDLVADQFKATVATIQDLTAEKVAVKLISPVPGDTNVTVQIGSEATPSGQFIVQNASGSAVAAIDNMGNATFSGIVNSSQLIVDSEATISGTLYADNIESKSLDEIKKLLTDVRTEQSLLAESKTWNINTATDSGNLATISNLLATDLYVTNQAAINSLSITNSLAIGSDLVLSSLIDQSTNQPINSLNSLSAPLRIQSLAMAPVEIMAGLFIIDTKGNVKISGDMFVAGRIEAGSLNLVARGNATESGKLLTMFDQSGNEVSSVNASGSALFSGLTTSGLTIAGAVDATNSAVVNGVITTNATAGTGLIAAGESAIIIKNPNVTDYTLVYVTPTSSTENYVLYVKSKKNGQFVVGFTNPIDIDVNFNWWIVKVSN